MMKMGKLALKRLKGHGFFLSGSRDLKQLGDSSGRLTE